MKTARFSAVVAQCGQPEAYTLWLAPDKDPEFQKALRQERIMSVHQSGAGHQADFGEVGYVRAQGELLLFPKSLRRYAGVRIIGLKYDLLAQPKLAPKAPRADSAHEARAQKSVSSPKRDTAPPRRKSRPAHPPRPTATHPPEPITPVISSGARHSPKSTKTLAPARASAPAGDPHSNSPTLPLQALPAPPLTKTAGARRKPSAGEADHPSARQKIVKFTATGAEPLPREEIHRAVAGALRAFRSRDYKRSLQLLTSLENATRVHR